MRIANNTILIRAVLFVAAFVAVCEPAFSQDQAATAAETSAESAAKGSVRSVASGALIRVALKERVNWAHVPKASVLEGELSLPLYAGERVLLPEGTAMRVIINSSEKVRAHAGFWRRTGQAIVRAFNPLEKSEAPQYQVTLKSAEIQLLSGEWAPLKASVVRAGSALIVGAQNKRRASGMDEVQTLKQTHRGKWKSGQILLLQSTSQIPIPVTQDVVAPPTDTSPASATARAYLLSGLSASESRKGDKFQAQLAEPVRLGDQVFGPGSVVEGTIVRSKAPRMLSRAGELHLRISTITAQNGEVLSVSGALSQAEADAEMRFILDEEGTLRGRKPGIKNGLADLGISYAVGKVSDDIAETPIRALGASMSDAAVANAARYVGLAGSLAFLVTRHGRDVRLPKYAEIEIDFGRVNKAATTSVPAL